MKPFLRALPAPPADTDWISEVGDWPMFMNDQVGDCTIAMEAHTIESSSRYGYGVTAQFSDDDVLEVYERVSGYNPANPESDQGAVLQDVYGDWQKVGIAGHKNLVFAQVDHKDYNEVKTCTHLFGSVGLGIVVTEGMMRDFEAGRDWTGNDGEELGGHAVPVLGYNASGVYVITWGRVQHMTWGCFSKVVEEAWVAILPDWFGPSGEDPLGADLHGLGEAYAELTGRANPFPDPNPQPTPEPSDDTDWQKVAQELAQLAEEAWHGIEGGWAIVKDFIKKHKLGEKE